MGYSFGVVGVVGSANVFVSSGRLIDKHFRPYDLNRALRHRRRPIMPTSLGQSLGSSRSKASRSRGVGSVGLFWVMQSPHAIAIADQSRVQFPDWMRYAIYRGRN